MGDRLAGAKPGEVADERGPGLGSLAELLDRACCRLEDARLTHRQHARTRSSGRSDVSRPSDPGHDRGHCVSRHIWVETCDRAHRNGYALSHLRALDADVEHLATVGALHEASRNPPERAELTATFRARHVDWPVDAACVHEATCSSTPARRGGLVLGLKLSFMVILPIHDPRACREGLGWRPPTREYDDLRPGTGRRGSFCFASIGDPILHVVTDIGQGHNS